MFEMRNVVVGSFLSAFAFMAMTVGTVAKADDDRLDPFLVQDAVKAGAKDNFTPEQKEKLANAPRIMGKLDEKGKPTGEFYAVDAKDETLIAMGKRATELLKRKVALTANKKLTAQVRTAALTKIDIEVSKMATETEQYLAKNYKTTEKDVFKLELADNTIYDRQAATQSTFGWGWGFGFRGWGMGFGGWGLWGMGLGWGMGWAMPGWAWWNPWRWWGGCC
jgi:hypothetical protein